MTDPYKPGDKVHVKAPVDEDVTVLEYTSYPAPQIRVRSEREGEYWVWVRQVESKEHGGL